MWKQKLIRCTIVSIALLLLFKLSLCMLYHLWMCVPKGIARRHSTAWQWGLLCHVEEVQVSKPKTLGDCSEEERRW